MAIAETLNGTLPFGISTTDGICPCQEKRIRHYWNHPRLKIGGIHRIMRLLYAEFIRQMALYLIRKDIVAEHTIFGMLDSYFLRLSG